MYEHNAFFGLQVGFCLMFDKDQKQLSALSCDSSYFSNLLHSSSNRNCLSYINDF